MAHSKEKKNQLPKTIAEGTHAFIKMGFNFKAIVSSTLKSQAK